MISEAETARAVQCAFAIWFGLRPKEAEALSALWRAEGEFQTLSDMATPNHVGVLVHRLRVVLSTEAIDSAPARGYRLTEIGQSECMGAVVAQLQILSDVAERRAA